MRNYPTYNNPSGRRSFVNRSFMWGVFEGVAGILTTIAAGMLLLSYGAWYVNPNHYWGFALLGLIAPILFLINILILLYWLIAWKKYVFIPLAVLLLGAGHISLFFRPMLGKHYSESQTSQGTTIKVMSYNVTGFLDMGQNPPISCMEQTLEFVREQAPDILCIQEFQATAKIPQYVIDTILSRLPYRTIQLIKTNRYDPNMGWGLAIYSRYPIVAHKQITFEDSNNSALSVDIVVRKDTIRVFNNHLQTTSITQSDKEYITSVGDAESHEDSLQTNRIRQIVGKLKRNYKVRATQADTVSKYIAESPYKIIVCGDFNDTPLSYTYHTIRDGLKDSFCEKGEGVINTYRGLFNMFRIDYILYSPQLTAVSYLSPSLDKSDHNPVISSFIMSQNDK